MESTLPETPQLCNKPAAFILSGFGGSSVKVCIAHAEWAQQIANAMGAPISLDPDVPESWTCEQVVDEPTKEPT